MKIGAYAKRIVTFTCVMFTLVTFLFVSVLSAMNVAGASVFRTDRLSVLLLFSFLTALASLLFDVQKLHVAVRVALNFVLCYLAMYLCVFVIYFNTSGMKEYTSYTPAQVVVATVAFVVCYAVAVAVKFIAAAIKRKNAKVKPYTKQFTDVK